MERNKLDLSETSAKAYSLGKLLLVSQDMINELVNLSIKVKNNEPNSQYILAYETSRVIDQLIELNFIYCEMAKNIEDSIDNHLSIKNTHEKNV